MSGEETAGRPHDQRDIKGLGGEKNKKNVSTEIRPDLVTKLSRGGDGRLSLGVDQLQAKTPPAVEFRQ